MNGTEQDNGDVILPESRRADGSIRKSVRIRAGYIAPDEVRKYTAPTRKVRYKKGQKIKYFQSFENILYGKMN